MGRRIVGHHDSILSDSSCHPKLANALCVASLRGHLSLCALRRFALAILQFRNSNNGGQFAATRGIHGHTLEMALLVAVHSPD